MTKETPDVSHVCKSARNRNCQWERNGLAWAVEVKSTCGSEGLYCRSEHVVRKLRDLRDSSKLSSWLREP